MHITNYDVDYFIRKFKAIHTSKWCADGLYNTGDKCCVLGHCGQRSELYNPEVLALCGLFKFCKGSYHPVTINDCGSSDYLQRTPRARILAALGDIKALEGKSKKEIENETN